MAKQYGAPTGVEKPKNEGRTKPQAGSPKSYLEHMVDAHNAYHAPQQQAPAKPPAGRGGTQMGRDVLGVGKPKVRRAIDDADKQS